MDQVAGIPLSLVLGLFRRRRPLPAEVNSIGILMLGVIGDTLLASAILPDLRQAYPRARITAFISHANWGTVDLLTGLDDVLVLSVKKPLSAARLLRRHPVDLMIDIGQWARISAVLAAMSGAKFTIGFKTSGQHRHTVFDANVDHSPVRHEIDNFRALLEPLGLTATGSPKLQADIMNDIERGVKSRTVVFHPWAAGYKSHLREWPDKRWAELARRLICDGYDIAITGGPSDYQRAKALSEMIDDPAVKILAGTTTLRQTAVILGRAACVVSVNTGVMHLAAIANAPLVALHGPTNPKRWGPTNPKAIVLGPGAEEGGAYLNLGFEYPPSPPDCMSKISVEDVLRSSLTAIEQSQKPDVFGRPVWSPVASEASPPQ